MKHSALKKICGIAIFSSLAFVVSLLFRFPVMFLTFDAKDAVITIAAFVYGPISAPIMALLASLLELSVSDTGVYGLIMNFASSTAFSFTASLIYKYKRTYTGSIIGLYSAVAVTTGVMLLLNYFVTPYYLGTTTEEVVAILPGVLLPFNFAKATLNLAIVMLLYKPVSVALRRVGLSITEEHPRARLGKKTVITILLATLSIVIAATIFLVLKY